MGVAIFLSSVWIQLMTFEYLMQSTALYDQQQQALLAESIQIYRNHEAPGLRGMGSHGLPPRLDYGAYQGRAESLAICWLIEEAYLSHEEFQC